MDQTRTMWVTGVDHATGTVTVGSENPNIPEIPQTPSCPRCEGRMVLRTAKRGPHSGTKFYGCADFPVCRGTREAEQKTVSDPTWDAYQAANRERWELERLRMNAARRDQREKKKMLDSWKAAGLRYEHNTELELRKLNEEYVA